MGPCPAAVGPQAKRFAAYMEALAKATEHADRHAPLMNYCMGLLLPGGRKSIEPVAALLAPHRVQAMRQSLHHFVTESAWSDEAVLAGVREQVLPVAEKEGPVLAWVVYETGFLKKGKHSAGVARQTCGETGRIENCQVVVSLAVATRSVSLPVAYRLYLPKEWSESAKRRAEAKVPGEIAFQTKPEIALDQIRAAVAANVARGVVLAGAGYGVSREFREALAGLGLPYVVGVPDSMAVWVRGEPRLPADLRGRRERPARPSQRAASRQPAPVKVLATRLPAAVYREVTWREGLERRLRFHFAAVRIHAAHRDQRRTEPSAEEWLLIEWPRGETEPTKYWMSNLPEDTGLNVLVKSAKHGWVVERDFQELREELGLGHFEGRNWRGFHHHATLCIAAYGFLVAERNRFSPDARAGRLEFHMPEPPPGFRPRGSPEPRRAG